MMSKGKIFIFLAASFTGFLIINSIDLSEVTKSITSLNAIEYKKAIEERNQLYKDIDNIKSENIEYRYKISQYKDDDSEKSEKLIQDMKDQLVDYGALSGTSSVKGPGLIIKIEDGDYNKLTDSEIDIFRKILHENDVALVLNEIRNAGAEAVAINEHRILSNTSVSCNWVAIGFEDNTRTFAPFYIYVIGNTEKIKAALLAENSVIKSLLLREIKIDIEEKDEVIIPTTEQTIVSQYMERYDRE